MHTNYQPLLSYVRPCAVWGSLRGHAAGSKHTHAAVSITDVVRIALHAALAAWLLACAALSAYCVATSFGLAAGFAYADLCALLAMPVTFGIIFLAVELGHPPFEGPLRRVLMVLRFLTFVLIHAWAFLARTWLYFTVFQGVFSALLSALGLRDVISPQFHGLLIAVGMSLSTALYV